MINSTFEALRGGRARGSWLHAFPKVKWQLCISVEKQVAEASPRHRGRANSCNFNEEEMEFYSPPKIPVVEAKDLPETGLLVNQRKP